MQKSIKKQLGVSLIEALVSLVVIGVGLLGLGGMQIASIKGTTNSHSRTVATMLAMDLADRMRANKVGLDDGEYDTSKSAAGTAVNCETTPTIACKTSGSSCSTKDTALFDLNEVMCGDTGSIKKALLNSSLSVTCETTGGVVAVCTEDTVHVLEIKWFASNIHTELDTTKLKSNNTQEFVLRHEIVSPP